MKDQTAKALGLFITGWCLLILGIVWLGSAWFVGAALFGSGLAFSVHSGTVARRVYDQRQGGADDGT